MVAPTNGYVSNGVFYAGVDVILDIVGAPYLNRNVEALAVGGRLFIIGLQEVLQEISTLALFWASISQLLVHQLTLLVCHGCNVMPLFCSSNNHGNCINNPNLNGDLCGHRGWLAEQDCRKQGTDCAGGS